VGTWHERLPQTGPHTVPALRTRSCPSDEKLWPKKRKEKEKKNEKAKSNKEMKTKSKKEMKTKSKKEMKTKSKKEMKTKSAN
jgi:hypothetical protein